MAHQPSEPGPTLPCEAVVSESSRPRLEPVGAHARGRAALSAAGAPNVTAVCALAPWLDGSDPVRQLVGRADVLGVDPAAGTDLSAFGAPASRNGSVREILAAPPR